MDPADKQAARYRSKNLMGYIQDKVDVGMTKLRSDEGKPLDVAVLKATLQDEVVPKEKHVVTLKVACAATAPRLQVNYVIHGLSKRLEDKPGWLVTLKTLIVFHRLLREVDPSFQDELIRFQDRTGAQRMLRLDAFADHTTKDTWDYSAWIRVYSIYLDERLGVFKAMRFDPEQEGGTAQHAGAVPPYGAPPAPYGAPPPPYGAPAPPYGAPGGVNGGAPADIAHGAAVRETKLKTCSAAELLEKLPLVQKLLSRLIACVPEGASQNNEIVLQSAIMVLRELRAAYRAVCEGIINLADKYFEMERADALRGLDIYRENVALNERLNTFFAAVNNVPLLRGSVQMPNLQSLPADFLTTMEEYVRDAPKTVDVTRGPHAGPTGGPASLRSSTTMIRAGGTTSPSLAGTGLPPTIPSPNQGVLKIGPPVGEAPPPAPPPPPAPKPEVDLLGDDFSPAPSQPPASQPSGPADAFGGAPAFASPAPPAAPPAGGFNPFAPPGADGSPPPPVQSFHSPRAPGAGPPSGPVNPFTPSFPGAPHVFAPAFPGGPAPQAHPGYPGPHGGLYASHPPPGAPPTNPFGGNAAPVWGSGPPPGASAWGTNAVPGAQHMKKSQDPLNDIGLDLFGKNTQPPVQQSLRDMKLQG